MSTGRLGSRRRQTRRSRLAGFCRGQCLLAEFEGPSVKHPSKSISLFTGQSAHDGVKSYGRMLDLVLAWYEDRSEAGQLDNSIAALAEKGD